MPLTKPSPSSSPGCYTQDLMSRSWDPEGTTGPQTQLHCHASAGGKPPTDFGGRGIRFLEKPGSGRRSLLLGKVQGSQGLRQK